MLLSSPCAMMERICICLLRDECQDGRDDQYCVHISSSFLSSTCLQDISIFLRLHSTVHARYIFPLRLDSTVPAGHFFPFQFILQCPLDISFLLRHHSTVPAGHFFPFQPSFYSARRTFLSFALSTVPAGHFFPYPPYSTVQCPQENKSIQ